MHLLPTRHSASRPDTGRLLRAARKIFLVVAGNAILALGIALFIEPTGIISGGTTGIGLVFQSLFGLPIPVTYGIVNLVCFVLGLVILGWQFAAGTLLSTVLFPFILSAAEQLPPLTDVTGDLFLCAVAAGVLSGAGMGLVIGEGASTGGLDIPPILCNRCFGLPVGSVMLVLNLATLAVQKIVATPKQVIYGILSVIVTSMVLDAVLKSGRQRTQVLIMSQQYEQIPATAAGPPDRGDDVCLGGRLCPAFGADGPLCGAVPPPAGGQADCLPGGPHRLCAGQRRERDHRPRLLNAPVI